MVQRNLCRRKTYQALIAYNYNLLRLYLPLWWLCQAELFQRQILFFVGYLNHQRYATPHQDVHGDLGCFISLRMMFMLAGGIFVELLITEYVTNLCNKSIRTLPQYQGSVENETPKTPSHKLSTEPLWVGASHQKIITGFFTSKWFPLKANPKRNCQLKLPSPPTISRRWQLKYVLCSPRTPRED